MRIARDFGTIDLLFPEGEEDLRDIPYTLFGDINSALVFLSFENMPSKQRPPRHLWLDAKAINGYVERFERGEDAPDSGQQNAAASLLLSD